MDSLLQSDVQQISVLDHGYVESYDCMGSDLSIVNAARVSFNKRSDELQEGDDKLINYLMKNRHGTPFEHATMTFVVKAPIFVFREWHRHRIASINEMSARYTTLPEDFYVPEVENVRTRVGKPGAYSYKQAQGDDAYFFRKRLRTQCEESYDLYKIALAQRIAPEQARLFLHVNHYSEMFWTVNPRSLMNFLNLRNAETAQWEIRQYAIVLEQFFAQKFPLTYEAFVANGRVAP